MAILIPPSESECSQDILWVVQKVKSRVYQKKTHLITKKKIEVGHSGGAHL